MGYIENLPKEEGLWGVQSGNAIIVAPIAKSAACKKIMEHQEEVLSCGKKGAFNGVTLEEILYEMLGDIHQYFQNRRYISVVGRIL